MCGFVGCLVYSVWWYVSSIKVIEELGECGWIIL